MGCHSHDKVQVVKGVHELTELGVTIKQAGRSSSQILRSPHGGLQKDEGGSVPLSVVSSITPRRQESGSNIEGPVETSKLEGSW